METRINPRVIFLIFIKIIVEVSCKGSLTFVIDDTTSMDEELNQVRDSVSRIKNIVLHERSSVIENMTLITFNDPGVSLKITTKDPDEFKKQLDAIHLHNEMRRNDCQEMAMTGLLLALEKSNPNSFIYLFTDASAKDYRDGKHVIDMCQKKQTQIVFVLTGLCTSYQHADFQVYANIARACSGLMFFGPRSDVQKVFVPIEETIKGNKTVITTATTPSNVMKTIPFIIDDQTDYAIVSAFGRKVYLKIDGPSLNEKVLMSSHNSKVVKLNNVIPGSYKVIVWSETNTSIIVVGRTDFFFSHGFSELKPKLLGDTSPQPIAGTKTYLSIFVTDKNQTIRIESAQILDLDEKPMRDRQPLNAVSEDFYVTEPFVAPSQVFKVAVHGIVKSTGKPITRIAKIPVTPPEPPPKLPDNTKPIAHIEEGEKIEVEYNSTVKLTCKVVAFPKPEISWFNSKQDVMRSKSSIQEYPYKYISYMEISHAIKGEIYKCFAVNNIGEHSTYINVDVKDPFTVKSRPPATIKVAYGSKGTITCDIRSHLPRVISWYYTNKITGQTRQIETSDKYIISADYTQLKIRKMDMELDGKYSCKAFLKNEQKLQKEYSTHVKIDGLVAPKIQAPTEIKVVNGKTAVFSCNIISGVPAPKITWLFGGKYGSKFTPIEGSGSILNIKSVSDKDAGKYKCVAENVVSKDEHITTLFVQDVPKIVSNNSTVYEGNEGDAVLEIPCVVSGIPKPVVVWKLKSRVITPNSKYSIDKDTLIIKDPKVSDTNSYTCEATNEVGAVSATFTTYIRQAPQVSGATNQKARLGKPVSIVCRIVNGVPAPKITWLYGGKFGSKFTPIDGASSILNIKSVSDKDAGKYKCVAENVVSKDEHITTLFVQDFPNILPNNSTVYDGNEGDAVLEIPCVVSGIPKPVVIWKLKNRVITPSAKYSIDKDTLIIKDPKVSDTNSYTCEATNEVGAVSATFTTYIRQAPQVSGATNQKARLGQPVSIVCRIVNGVPAPKITWLFGGKSGSKFEPIKGSSSALNIKSVSDKDAGKYKCVAENVVSKDEHITTLFVQDFPKIVSNNSTVYEGNEGDAILEIPCVVSGIPKPVVIWKLKNRVITPNPKYSIDDGMLIIKDPKVSDTNSYTCEATNEVGAVSATFTTYIRQAPQVAGTTNQKARLGTAISIECRIVSGVPAPKITWLFGGKSGSTFTPIDGTGSVLNIKSVRDEDAGKYKCVAENKVSKVEHITTLFVQDIPKIISNTFTIYEGNEGDDSLEIPCVASGAPKPVVIWKLNSRILTPSVKYSILNGRLKIKHPKVSDTNSYTCEATNEVGAVSATFTTYIRQAPQVSGAPNQKVRLSTSTSIECRVVSGVPAPKITWLFAGKSDSGFTPIEGSGSILNIKNVSNEDAGKYKCVAENVVSKDEHITTLYVQDFPKIISNNSTVYAGNEGDAVLKIPCVVSGIPKPVVVWKLKHHIITFNSKYSIDNNTLIIKDPKVSDTNSYTCEATNEVGAVSATFTTYIRQAPQVSGASNQKVRLGSSTNIDCRIVSGVPAPKITWQFGGKSGLKFEPIKGSGSVLNIKSVSDKDAGKYKCVAENVVSKVEHITTLFVQEIPKITSKSSTVYNGTEGDAFLEVPCVASGAPQPVIMWKLNNHVITSGAKYSFDNGTLIIKDPKVSDTNSYTCEATNEVGAVSATFTTNVRQAPQVSGVTNQKVRLGSSASIQCRILSGVPAPEITWLFGGKSGSKFTPIEGSDSVLNIKSVSDNDAGNYKCVAENVVNKDEHITTLFVQDVPKIFSNNSTVYEGNEGDAVLEIPCVTSGIPKPAVVWKLKNRVLTTNGKYSINDDTLIIKDPKVSDTNSYTCEATNEVGAVSATFTTYIRQAPHILGASNQKVKLGRPVSIECRIVSGVPIPKITWLFGGKPGLKFEPIEGSGSVLNIKSVSDKDAGKYKCVAENVVSKDEHITMLFVQDIPKITSNSSTVYQGNEGDAVLKIPCVVSGAPKPLVVWKLNSRVITPTTKYSFDNGTLIIKDPKVSDTNSYTCEATNEVGAVSATFTTYIRQAPQVSGTTNQKVRLGTAASIECRILSGVPTPKITWWFGGEFGSKFTPIEGNGSVLNIKSVSDEDAGKYKCVAENVVSKDEHIMTLFVQDVPKIISNSSAIYDGTEGDELLEVPCVATGAPKPVIIWKLNNRVITPSAKYSIENGTLFIRNPKVSDTKSYTCEATNEVDSVQATFTTYIRQIPQVSGVTDTKVIMGELATIECRVVKGVPQPKITWQFMESSSSKFVPINGSENVLRIVKAENENAGRYKCVAHNDVGSGEHVTTLIVESPPRIIAESKSVEAVEGDLALRIPCDVVGIPRPVVTWKLKGETIIPNTKYSFEDGALVIMKPKKEDTSAYTCEAKNYLGAVNATFKATVDKELNNFGTEHDLYLLKDQSSKIKCDAYNSNSQSIKWFLNYDAKDTTEPYIQIEKATLSDTGNYTCHVSDKHGNVQTHTYHVYVGNAPEFEPINSLDDWQGDVSAIRTNCEHTGSPEPDTEWTYNGKVINDEEVGISYKWGHYACNVSNVHGSVLRSFDVQSTVCLISRNLNEIQHMPLILNNESSWPEWTTTLDYTVVEPEEQITLSCPGQNETHNYFQNFPKQSIIKANCYKEDIFIVNGKNYKISELQCSISIEPTIVRKKVVCSKDSELIRVGYNAGGFLEIYEVCFNNAENLPVYTRIIMRNTDSPKSNPYNWHTYPGIGDRRTEGGYSCKGKQSSCCYDKTQLVNAKDFNNDVAQNSLFIDPLNAVPAWRHCDSNHTTWEEIDTMVRSQLVVYDDIIAWSGTHTLQEKGGAVIPRYLWKVLRFDYEQALAIVYINDPEPTKKDVKCTDTCANERSWLTVKGDGMYCCSLSDFLEAFEIYDTHIGDSLGAVLDEIQRSA